MPDPLATAQELFEAGSVEEPADLLRQIRDVAMARGRVDVAAEVNEAAEQMRARMTSDKQEEFDRVLERGQPAGSLVRPMAAAFRDPVVLALSLAAVVTLVVAWVQASSEDCHGTDRPASLTMLLLSVAAAGGAGLMLGLRNRGRASRRTVVGVASGLTAGVVWLLWGGIIWWEVSVGDCPLLTDWGF